MYQKIYLNLTDHPYLKYLLNQPIRLILMYHLQLIYHLYLKYLMYQLLLKNQTILTILKYQRFLR
jgi:hypothetical protein